MTLHIKTEKNTMRHLKKYLLLVLALALCLSLSMTACGSSGVDAGGDWDDPNEIGGTDWRTTGVARDGGSDVTMVFDDGNGELLMVWLWDEESGLFVYQPEESQIGDAAA